MAKPNGDTPSRSRRTGKGSPKKKKSRRSSAPLWIGLGIGGGILALGLVGFLILQFVPLGGRKALVEKALNRQADFRRQVSDELEKIQSAADADAAAGKIEEIANKLGFNARPATSPSANLPGQAANPADLQLDPAAMDELRVQVRRLNSAIDRLEDSNLFTEKLLLTLRGNSVLYSDVFNLLPPSEKPVDLPVPEITQDQCYAELLRIAEQMTDAFAKCVDLASTKQHAANLRRSLDEEYAVLYRLAFLGAPQPPQGVPEAFQAKINAAAQRRAQLNVNPSAADKLPMMNLLDQIKRSNGLKCRVNPWDLKKEILAEGRGKMVTIQARSTAEGRGLGGTQYDVLAEVLAEQAKVPHFQVVKLHDLNGFEIRRLILAPVDDLNQFAGKITGAKVTGVNSSGRTMTVAVDAKEFPYTMEAWKQKNP